MNTLGFTSHFHVDVVVVVIILSIFPTYSSFLYFLCWCFVIQFVFFFHGFCLFNSILLISATILTMLSVKRGKFSLVSFVYSIEFNWIGFGIWERVDACVSDSNCKRFWWLTYETADYQYWVRYCIVIECACFKFNLCRHVYTFYKSVCVLVCYYCCCCCCCPSICTTFQLSVSSTNWIVILLMCLVFYSVYRHLFHSQLNVWHFMFASIEY